MFSLLNVVRRMEDESEQPTPYNIVRTPGDPTIVLGVNKRTTKDQPQRSVDQFSFEVGKHVSCGVNPVAFMIELLDRVWQLRKR